MARKKQEGVLPEGLTGLALPSTKLAKSLGLTEAVVIASSAASGPINYATAGSPTHNHLAVTLTEMASPTPADPITLCVVAVTHVPSGRRVPSTPRTDAADVYFAATPAGVAAAIAARDELAWHTTVEGCTVPWAELDVAAASGAHFGRGGGAEAEHLRCASAMASWMDVVDAYLTPDVRVLAPGVAIDPPELTEASLELVQALSFRLSRGSSTAARLHAQIGGRSLPHLCKVRAHLLYLFDLGAVVCQPGPPEGLAERLWWSLA